MNSRVKEITQRNISNELKQLSNLLMNGNPTPEEIAEIKARKAEISAFQKANRG